MLSVIQTPPAPAAIDDEGIEEAASLRRSGHGANRLARISPVSGSTRQIRGRSSATFHQRDSVAECEIDGSADGAACDRAESRAVAVVDACPASVRGSIARAQSRGLSEHRDPHGPVARHGVGRPRSPRRTRPVHRTRSRGRIRAMHEHRSLSIAQTAPSPTAIADVWRTPIGSCRSVETHDLEDGPRCRVDRGARHSRRRFVRGHPHSAIAHGDSAELVVERVLGLESSSPGCTRVTDSSGQPRCRSPTHPRASAASTGPVEDAGVVRAPRDSRRPHDVVRLGIDRR